MIDSPFIRYCDELDDQLYGQPEDIYFHQAKKIYNDPKGGDLKIANLLISDFEYREKYQNNIIIGIQGEQGDFKSLFGQSIGGIIGNIYKNPLDIENNLKVIPEDFVEHVRKAPYRTTHILDEGRNKNVGVGSTATELDLEDFEDHCRWTQKNIIRIKPELEDYRPYFKFSSRTFERVENKKFCSVCPIDKNDAIFKKLPVLINQHDCNSKKFQTNCKNVDFWERTGYPLSMTFTLRTIRKIDGMYVIRGFVKLPMIDKDLMIKYDKIKGINVKKLETQEEDSFKLLENTAIEFIKANRNKIIFKNATSNYVSVSKEIIEIMLYTHLKSMRKYTVKQIDLIKSSIKHKLLLECNTLNLKKNVIKTINE